ncbi:hypothetical protein QAD02_009359 [Eretmocerus hayati]|uniref:Uncharacterized protein n=1 Tax=Eretmocerus hayati TaxID=131215 RepID=A0ACC2N9V9_9HYME|nr:hypothetical protein QAD02_009359 [Eretmocerus hayati]
MIVPVNSCPGYGNSGIPENRISNEGLNKALEMINNPAVTDTPNKETVQHVSRPVDINNNRGQPGPSQQTYPLPMVPNQPEYNQPSPGASIPSWLQEDNDNRHVAYQARLA